MKNNLLLPALLSLLLLLTACPKERMWYTIFVRNSHKIVSLKIFIHQDNPGDSLLPADKRKFNDHLETFNTDYSTSFRICIHEIRGIRDCIASQPEQKIYMFVFDADTLAAYDYAVIRDKKKYKDRVEIPYTMATNDADLKIDYPQPDMIGGSALFGVVRDRVIEDDGLFKHAYGHAYDSHRFGVGYLSGLGLVKHRLFTDLTGRQKIEQTRR